MSSGFGNRVAQGKWKPDQGGIKWIGIEEVYIISLSLVMKAKNYKTVARDKYEVYSLI